MVGCGGGGGGGGRIETQWRMAFTPQKTTALLLLQIGLVAHHGRERGALMMIGAANCGPHCHRIRPPRAPLLVQDPQPTGRAKVCMHTLAFPAGGWGILGYIYIYNMQRGPRGTNSLAMGSDYRRSALQDANRELRLAKQCCRRRRSCRRRRCRGLAASSPQVQFYGVCAREVELLVIKLAVGDLVEREGRAY